MNRIALFGFAAIALFATGCGQSAQQDTQTAGADAKNAGAAIQADAQKASNSVKADANHAKRVGEDDVESDKINSAFASAAGLEASNLKVSTDMSNKTITVKGTVPSSSQRDQERKIVSGIAGKDFKVKDAVGIAPVAK